jgi:dolichyl-phosphate-mannose-protein mannosyltransferase
MSILTGENPKPLRGAALVTIAAAVLYFLTAARDIVVGDTPELITAAAVLGVAHPPGYPLFTMLGHAFSLLPFGTIPFRVNLFSVVCDSLTVGVVYLTAWRLTRSQLASTVGALLLVITPAFWSWSLVAEVFPLNNLLVTAVIYSLVVWQEQPQNRRGLLAASFLFGLTLTNQHTSVLIVPAIAFLLWRQRSLLLERPRLVLAAAVMIAVGLLPYAYIPWAAARHPIYNWGEVSSFDTFLNVVTRRGYGTFHLVNSPGYWGGSPLLRIGVLCTSFGLIAGVLILLGAIRAYRRARWYFWFTLIAFVFAGPFFVWITNLNVQTAPSALFVLQRFFLLSQVVLAPLTALGACQLAEFIQRRIQSSFETALRLIAAACLVSIVISLTTSYRRIDQSRNSIARNFAEDVFAMSPPHSLLIADGDIAFPLLYMQRVENIGKDTTLIVLPLLLSDWYVKQLRSAQPDLIVPFETYAQSNNLKVLVEANRGRPVCVVGTIGNNDHSLDQDYWPYQNGMLMTVEPKSKTIPLEQMISENETLLARSHPPAFEAVHRETFESDILNIYAWPAFRIGTDCERVGLAVEARNWYQRALAINPQFRQAREAIARLEH